MILPTKHLNSAQALIGVGAILLNNLKEPKTLSSLWELVKFNSDVGSFERFILSLDMLYVIGTINIDDGKIKKVIL